MCRCSLTAVTDCGLCAIVCALSSLEPSYHNRTLGDAEADATPLVDLATGGNHDTPLHFACAQGRYNGM